MPVALLVVLDAGFAGSEIALISLREGQLRRLEQQHETGRILARLARDPNRSLSTIQVGITLAGFLASATAAVSLAEPLVEPFGFLGAAAKPVAIVVVTLVLAFVIFVFGELAPKRVAMQRAERWALMAARPLAAIASLARPVIWLLGASTEVAVRVMGGDRAASGRTSPRKNFATSWRPRPLSPPSSGRSSPGLSRLVTGRCGRFWYLVAM